MEETSMENLIEKSPTEQLLEQPEQPEQLPEQLQEQPMEEQIEGYNINVDVNYYEKIPKEYPENSYISKEIDQLYKSQFLEAMNEKEYDEDLIMNKLDFIYSIFKETKLNNIMDKLCKCISFDLTDNTIGFFLLFSFDFYYITHQILCYYIIRHEIHEELYNVLNEKIECLFNTQINR